MTHKKKASNILVKRWFALVNAQALQQAIALVRIKSVAIIIGSAGVGFNGLINSTLIAFQQFSGFGLHQSAIRSISSEKNKPFLEQYAYSAFNKLVCIFSFFGFLLCLVMSPWLSDVVFNTRDHQLSFAFVSISILLTGIGGIYTTLMQSEGRVVLFAKTNIISALLTLAASIPIFIFMKVNGVIPVIILGSFFFWATSYFYSKSTHKNQYAKCRWRDLYMHGESMLKLGAVLMISNTAMALMGFALNASIASRGGLSDVGLYLSAANIIAVSLAVVNASVASDFFPRLTAAINSKSHASRIISGQIEIAISAIVPISVLLIALSPVVIKMLLSEEFTGVTSTLQLMASALLFRSIWNILAYCILAAGDNWTYFFYDTVLGNGFNFILNLTLYRLFGLDGLGFSFLMGSIFSAFVLSIVIKIKYNYKIKKITLQGLILIVMPVFAALLAAHYISSGYRYGVFGALIVLTTMMAFLKFKKITQRTIDHEE